MPIHADLSICVKDLGARMEAYSVQEAVNAFLLSEGYDAEVDVTSTWGEAE